MTFWIDQQLSPALASWLRTEHSLDAVSVRSLGFHNADDKNIFFAAQKIGIVVITKDRDFVQLVEQFGIPPQILWISFGNTSNAVIKSVLSKALPQILPLIERGEQIIELRQKF